MVRKKYPLIVFCGMDGSGKTTLAQALADYLKRRGVDVEFVHGHGYTISENSFGLDPKKVNRMKYILRVLIPFAFVDNLFTYFFKYRPIFKKKILICDRYFYDKVARMLYYGISNYFIAKAYLKLLPKPDAIFFLDVSAEKALERKKEYSKEEFSLFREKYQYLAKYLKVPIIETGLPLDICVKEIIKDLPPHFFK